MDLSKFEKKIKIKFKKPTLLQTALTHRSYLNENRDHKLPHNERLEFLGDAVLELITTEYLYEHFENPEGELTNLRASLVNYRTLSDVASTLGLDDFLLLSKGEMKDMGRARQVILANACEALIGAIYLDQGLEEITKFITQHILSKLDQIIKERAYEDPKSKLQEIIQEQMAITPTYQVISESGPDHAKSFLVGVYIDDRLVGQGNGSSKQDAEVEAAKDALEKKKF